MLRTAWQRIAAKKAQRYEKNIKHSHSSLISWNEFSGKTLESQENKRNRFILAIQWKRNLDGVDLEYFFAVALNDMQIRWAMKWLRVNV